LLSEIGGSFLTATELGGGITAEFLAGAAGIALGILSILGIVPMVLLPAAIIVYGAALLLSSGATARLNSLAAARPEVHEIARHVAREAVFAAAGAQVLIGLSGVILGILALVGFTPLILSLVALPSLGSAVLLSGAAINSKMLSMQCR
jgi:hypothetical protein